MAPDNAFRRKTMRAKLDARLQMIRARIFSAISQAAFRLALSIQDLF
jgi:hypothetical protein